MDISSLRELWGRISFSPRKSMGQNYLIDRNIVDKLINSYDLSEDDHVIEIGPGFGAMTAHIAERCSRLRAVEKDRKAFSELASSMAHIDNVEVVNEDFLSSDICSFAPDSGSVKLVGNIPYSLSSPIIEKTLSSRMCVKVAYLVMQQELVERITASPGGRDYSRLSVFVQLYSRPKKMFKIKRNSFYPVPKVDSALLRLEISPHPVVAVEDEDLMMLLVKKAFSQRRKKAVNSIADSFADQRGPDKALLRESFNDCGVGISVRAEEISLGQWARVSDLLGRRWKAPHKKDEACS